MTSNQKKKKIFNFKKKKKKRKKKKTSVQEKSVCVPQDFQQAMRNRFPNFYISMTTKLTLPRR